MLLPAGRAELTHPAVLAILHWKYNKFGSLLLKVEVGLYSLLVTLVSVSTVLLQDQLPNDYSGGLGSARKACEIGALIVTAVFIWYQYLDLQYYRQSTLSTFGHVKSQSLPLAGIGSILATLVCRFAPVSTGVMVEAQAVAVVLVWLRLLFLMRYHPNLGSFFIMVVDMIERDLTKFAYVSTFAASDVEVHIVFPCAASFWQFCCQDSRLRSDCLWLTKLMAVATMERLANGMTQWPSPSMH